MAGFHERHGWPRAQTYDPERLRVLVAHHGEHRAAFLAGVPRATLRRWLDGTRAAPHAAGALLWHLSAFGKTTDDIHRENRLRTLQGLADALQARADVLAAELVRQARHARPGCANDPWAADPADPRAGIAGRPA